MRAGTQETQGMTLGLVAAIVGILVLVALVSVVFIAPAALR